MNKKILLSGQKTVIYYETLNHLWGKQPFKFRFCPTNHGRSPTCVHKDIEFNLVTAGALPISLNGKEHIVKEGELVFVNQYVPHAVSSFDSTRYTHMIISTKFLQENGLDLSKLWFQEIIADPGIKYYFDKMEEEFRGRKPYFKTRMQGLILELMGYLAGNYTTERTEDADECLRSYGSDFEYVRLAIDYITENAHKNLTAEEISRFVGLSQYHFMRVFKKVTGSTLIDYINNFRCDKARQMLLSGDYSVTEVALSSGFNNTSYFAKVFKKHTGSLPTELLPKRKE